MVTLLLVPAERIGSIQFRLLFDGAADSKYPNGTAFNPAEIVAAPVLTDVYESNNLERFGEYSDFKDAIFVLQSSPELQLLAYEYEARLAETRLTSVERAGIEEEFLRRRESLKDPVYSLNLRRHERFTTVPDDLMAKVLNDTLAIWANQADERKGATRYDVPVLSRNILPADVLESEDYLVAVDILRVKAERLIDAIEELENVPGAEIVRIGESQVSLPEVKANLQDVIRFELEPLLGIIRSEGVSQNPRGLALYANSQLFQRRSERDAAASRVSALRDALGQYMAQRSGRSAGESVAGATAGRQIAPGFETPALIPQFGESFLDRLVQMSTATQTSEVEYRQELTNQIIQESERLTKLEQEAAYYEDLVRAVGSSSRAGDALETAALITERSERALEAIGTAVDQTMAIYRELSTQNLNPSTVLYAATEPFVIRTQRALSLATIGLGFVFVMLLSLMLIPAGCLAHRAIRHGAGMTGQKV